MDSQSEFESSQELSALFAQGGEIAVNATKGFCPPRLRKPPEIFCRTLTIRISLSAWLLSKGTEKSSKKRSTASWCWQSRSSKLRAVDLFGSSLLGRLLVADPVDWPDSLWPAQRHTALSSPAPPRDPDSFDPQSQCLIDSGFHLQKQPVHVSRPRLFHSSCRKISSRR